MDCAKVKNLASEYVEGTLPSALKRAVETHAASCHDCADALESLRLLYTQLESLPAVEMPPYLHENIMAALEHQNARQDTGWRALLPQLGRVAFGTMAMGGVVAAVAWMLLLPMTESPAGLATATPLSRLPGITTRTDSTVVSVPELIVTRQNKIDPDYGDAYEFTVSITGAPHGTARIGLFGDPTGTGPTTVTRFVLADDMPRALRIPFASVKGDVMRLTIHWSAADGKMHVKQLFVPMPGKDAKPEARQSFGLEETTLFTAARAVAARYGTPVTLEDVADLDHVMVIARDETASSALTRALAGRGVAVSAVGPGVLIAPAGSAAP